MSKQHVVRLTAEQRARLRRLLRRDATTALQQRRARILLASDGGADLASPTDVAVASAVGVDARTVARVRAAVYVPHRDAVRGFVYDVSTGRLREVI